MAFDLEIVSPEKKIFKGSAKKLSVPAVTGQLTILSQHTPLFTPLSEGKIKLQDVKGGLKEFNIGKGMLEVKQNHVIVLAEPPESADRIVKQKTKEAYKKAKAIDKSKIKAKGVIQAEDAFIRPKINLKGVKRRKKPKRFPVPE